MANQWFRMYSDFLEDAKIVSLAFEDQRHFIGVLALKSAGLLDQECAAEVMDRLVAQKLWVDRSSIVEVKRRLVEVGLIVRTIRRGPYARHEQPDQGEAAAAAPASPRGDRARPRAL